MCCECEQYLVQILFNNKKWNMKQVRICIAWNNHGTPLYWYYDCIRWLFYGRQTGAMKRNPLVILMVNHFQDTGIWIIWFMQLNFSNKTTKNWKWHPVKRTVHYSTVQYWWKFYLAMGIIAHPFWYVHVITALIK